jgi:hypothetical protein
MVRFCKVDCGRWLKHSTPQPDGHYGADVVFEHGKLSYPFSVDTR